MTLKDKIKARCYPCHKRLAACVEIMNITKAREMTQRVEAEAAEIHRHGKNGNAENVEFIDRAFRFAYGADPMVLALLELYTDAKAESARLR